MCCVLPTDVEVREQLLGVDSHFLPCFVRWDLLFLPLCCVLQAGWSTNSLCLPSLESIGIARDKLVHMAFYLGSRDLNLRRQAFRTVLSPAESFPQLYFVLIPRPPLWFYFICACCDYVTFSPRLPLCHSR